MYIITSTGKVNMPMQKVIHSWGIDGGKEIKKCINDVVVWVKLKVKFLGIMRDIYIAVAYIVPECSTHAGRDAFALLQNDDGGVPQENEISICGDYNAHTNIENDNMIESFIGNNVELEKLVCGDHTGSLVIVCKLSERKMPQRFAQDSKRVDTHGRFLLELYKAFSVNNTQWHSGTV